tara:strand:+ start:157 stop:621 length:465 start_codon:yes stop_codon:yes gene_type:complete
MSSTQIPILAKTLKHIFHPITITKPAWNKFRSILSRHDADTIHIGVKKVESCSCIERTAPSILYNNTDTIYKPTLSLVDSKVVYSQDKRYPPRVLYDEDTRAIFTPKTAGILSGLNIHYSPADYFNGKFDNKFIFTSMNVNVSCHCGNIVQSGK